MAVPFSVISKLNPERHCWDKGSTDLGWNPLVPVVPVYLHQYRLVPVPVPLPSQLPLLLPRSCGGAPRGPAGREGQHRRCSGRAPAAGTFAQVLHLRMRSVPSGRGMQLPSAGVRDALTPQRPGSAGMRGCGAGCGMAGSRQGDIQSAFPVCCRALGRWARLRQRRPGTAAARSRRTPGTAAPGRTPGICSPAWRTCCHDTVSREHSPSLCTGSSRNQHPTPEAEKKSVSGCEVPKSGTFSKEGNSAHLCHHSCS